MTFDVLAILDRIWSETSSQVRYDFGDKYFKNFRDYIKYFNKTTSGNNNQVLEPLMEAITMQTVFPKYLCCSPFNRLIIWSFNWLPIQCVDALVPFCTFRAIPHWIDVYKNS